MQQSMQKGGNLKSNLNLNAASEAHEYQNASNAPENDPTKEGQEGMTAKRYIMTSLQLCKPHACLLLTAFGCLLTTSVVSLALPKLSGHCIDAINSRNSDDFGAQMKKFLIYSVVC